MLLSGCNPPEPTGFLQLGDPPVIEKGGYTTEFELRSGRDPELDSFSTLRDLVVVDSLLFVPEILSLRVNVYDVRSGDFLFDFGPSRGLAGDEVLGITNISYSSRRNQIALIDKSSKKILWYDTEGALVETMALPAFYASNYARIDGDRLVFAQYQPDLPALGGSGAIHSMDLETQSVEQSLFEAGHLSMDTPEVRSWHVSRPGLFSIDSAGGMIYVTHDYEGAIWVKEAQDDRPEYRVNGLATEVQPSVLVQTADEIGNLDAAYRDGRFNVSMGGAFYSYRNTSRGLLAMGGGVHLHFLTILADGEMCLVVQEVSQERREVRRAMNLRCVPLTPSGTGFVEFTPLAIDPAGRILVVTSVKGTPVIQSIRLAWPTGS